MEHRSDTQIPPAQGAISHPDPMAPLVTSMPQAIRLMQKALRDLERATHKAVRVRGRQQGGAVSGECS